MLRAGGGDVTFFWRFCLSPFGNDRLEFVDDFRGGGVIFSDDVILVIPGDAVLFDRVHVEACGTLGVFLGQFLDQLPLRALCQGIDDGAAVWGRLGWSRGR